MAMDAALLEALARRLGGIGFPTDMTRESFMNFAPKRAAMLIENYRQAAKQLVAGYEDAPLQLRGQRGSQVNPELSGGDPFLARRSGNAGWRKLAYNPLTEELGFIKGFLDRDRHAPNNLKVSFDSALVPPRETETQRQLRLGRAARQTKRANIVMRRHIRRLLSEG